MPIAGGEWEIALDTMEASLYLTGFLQGQSHHTYSDFLMSVPFIPGVLQIYSRELS